MEMVLVLALVVAVCVGAAYARHAHLRITALESDVDGLLQKAFDRERQIGRDLALVWGRITAAEKKLAGRAEKK